ncbi:MAG: hypothetical protein GF421_01125 [Candidatus Aminicenantes bacterium]|nr:hypothetical protein [Candidatus Aminicenantes bacterium]
MKFATVINCMDGRVQLPVLHYLNHRFGVSLIDTITEPGPNLILAHQKDKPKLISILDRLKISIEKHGSKQVAIIGHHDCAGNPASKDEQIIHIQKAVTFICRQYPDAEVIGVWIDENWQITEIPNRS